LIKERSPPILPATGDDGDGGLFRLVSEAHPHPPSWPGY
jgi:hypothetical protein